MLIRGTISMLRYAVLTTTLCAPTLCCHAQTFEDALATTYLSNPQLAAERQRLRGHSCVAGAGSRAKAKTLRSGATSARERRVKL